MFEVRGGQVDGTVDDLRARSEVMRSLERELRSVEARIAAEIAHVDRTGIFTADGHSTVGAWCRAVNRWSNAETTARVRAARLAQREPKVAQTLASGEVGVAQVRELGRAAANPRCGTQLGGFLPTLLPLAAELSFEDFRLVVRRWEMLADTDGTHRDRETTHASRSASLTETGDEFILRANCDLATGTALKEILDRFTDIEWHTDWAAARAEHGDTAAVGKLQRTDGQRRFDALAAIFLRAGSTPADGRAPEPLVNLVLDTVTLERLLNKEPAEPRPDDPRWWRSETTDGTPVPPDDIIDAMIWGRVRRIVIDTNDGMILDVGRRQRLFTGRALDAVLLRTARCTWPGCLRPSSKLQGDHRVEYQHGGTTDTANGDGCCPRHNRFKSRAHITVTRDEHGHLHHWRPDGTEISRAPRREGDDGG